MRKIPEKLRAPGVYFLPSNNGTATSMPSLDVAAFVGFAERGPLNLPILLDDFGSFPSIFGGDLPLATERSMHMEGDSPPSESPSQSAHGANGKVVYANLPRTVEAFFANGGRRCYVVRVAGRKARAARFRIPGMVALGGLTTPVQLAGVSASSPGAWADQLRLAARLHIASLHPAEFSWLALPSGPGLSTRQALMSRFGLRVGDVLRLKMNDGSHWLLPVNSISSISSQQPSARPPKHDLCLRCSRVLRLWKEPPGNPSPGILSASRLTVDGLLPVNTFGPLRFQSQKLAVGLPQGNAKSVQPGDVLLLKLDDDREVLFPVETMDASSGLFDSPLSPPESFRLAVGSELLQISPDKAFNQEAAIESVNLLHFDLLVRSKDQQMVMLDLSFNLGGNRFWGEAVLPETALHPSIQAGGTSRSRLESGGRSMPDATGQDLPVGSGASAAAAWFTRLTWDAFGLTPPAFLRSASEDPNIEPSDPLAVLSGLLAPAGSDVTLDRSTVDDDACAAYQQLSKESNLTYLPLGMPLFFDASDPRQFIGPEEGWKGEDDLAVFTPEVFLDSRLSPSEFPGMTGSGENARTLLASALNLNAIQGRRLYGLHSLLFVDEVALVSMPDACHRKWEVFKPPSSSPPRPALPAEKAVCLPDADFALCSQAPKVLQVEPHHGSLGEETPVVVRGAGFSDSSKTQVFFGPLSASQVKVLSSEELACQAPNGLTAGTVSVRVENQNGTGELNEGFIYEAAVFGLDSDLAALPTIDLDAPEVEASKEPFLLVHQALLDFCQARGDCLAVLSLPKFYDLSQSLNWQDAFRLRLGLPLINPAAMEEGVSGNLIGNVDLSYAAVYHPWLSVADVKGPGGMRDVPPDGAVCGLIAARERSRGVWVAPANMRIRDAVGLRAEFSDHDWAVLFSRRFNLIRHEADGCRPMSAHTLSDQHDLLQISVRRLMFLLRKVLWRTGMDFVFETNHERFREGVRVVLEDMLRNLFNKGAFSGASPNQAFRVLADVRVNPLQHVEQGRFEVVVQVAPSEPMEFLAVQLVRAGEAIHISER